MVDGELDMEDLYGRSPIAHGRTPVLCGHFALRAKTRHACPTHVQWGNDHKGPPYQAPHPP
jgi:hypothetical protein